MYKELTSDILATVLILDKRLEPQPEPFRCQPKVHFVISFEEYVKFIRNDLDSGYNWLYTSTKVLLENIRELDQQNTESARQELFTAFLRDMAFAVMKELCIAEALGKGATRISHTTSLSKTVLDHQDYSRYFANVKSHIEPVIIDYLSRNDYSLRRVSGPNRYLYEYAITLMFLADKRFYWSSK